MGKKIKKGKNQQSKKDKENEVIPAALQFKKVSVQKSIHSTTLNFCFLSKTNNYIITCSSSYLSLLDINNFNVLSKYKMYEPILFLIELTNNRILLCNAKLIYIFEVQNNTTLNLLYFYEEKNYEKMGVIGCFELDKENILIITPTLFKYYKQQQIKNEVLKLYDTFDIGNIIELKYEDYGTQFKSSFLINNNNFIVLLTHQEMYIINHINKSLVKKIEIELPRSLLKYLNLEKNSTLIYHKKRLILFNNEHFEIVNQFSLNNDKDEITCVEKIKKDKCLVFGTNNGKIYVYNYYSTEIIKEINFEEKIFNIFWIKEINDYIIVNNLPKGEIAFTNYDSGKLIGKISLKNSLNYRKGVFVEETKKLLLGCANNFAFLE